jgi:glyoxylase-like metal-dependent hydrolase (beta-lactamase superfamily II)
VDAGIADEATKAAWDALLPGIGPVQALLVTHHHPDHIGLAGLLCEKLDVPLWTSRTAFLLATTFVHTPGLLEADEYARFYAAHGLPPDAAHAVISQGHRYLQRLSVPPRSFRRLAAGDTLVLGARRWTILTGEGHAPEQLLLHAPAENLLLAADQVIERITPNVSVLAFEPDGDPLGDFLASLAALKARTSPDTLVLSGHRLPFRGLHARLDQLRAHHEARCATILRACEEAPRTVHDLLPILFPREMDPHETGFAVSEALAHVNHMAGQGTLVWETDGPLRRVRRA